MTRFLDGAQSFFDGHREALRAPLAFFAGWATAAALTVTGLAFLGAFAVAAAVLAFSWLAG